MAHTHDNELFFHVDGISKMSYGQTSFCITDGQPYEGTRMYDVENGVSKVVIVAGRKGSNATADYYNGNTGLAHSVASKVSLDLQPDKLNFAVQGNLTITAKTSGKMYQSEVLLAQGHNTYNNWWVGSKSIYGYPGSFFGTSRGLLIMSITEDEVKRQIEKLFTYVYNGVCTLVNKTELFLEEALKMVQKFVIAINEKISAWSESHKYRILIDKAIEAISSFLTKIIEDINNAIDSLEDFAKKIEGIVKNAFELFIESDNVIMEWVIKLYSMLDLCFLSITEQDTNDFAVCEWKLFQ